MKISLYNVKDIVNLDYYKDTKVTHKVADLRQNDTNRDWIALDFKTNEYKIHAVDMARKSRISLHLVKTQFEAFDNFKKTYSDKHIQYIQVK